MVPKADRGAFLLLFLLVLTVTEPLRPGARRGRPGRGDRALRGRRARPGRLEGAARVPRTREAPPRRAFSESPGRELGSGPQKVPLEPYLLFPMCTPPPTSVREKSRARTQGRFSRQAQKAGARRAPVGCRGSKLSGKEPDAVARTHKCVRFCIDAVAE